MKNQNMKKIIFKAVAILFVVLILTPNLQAGPDHKQIDKEKDPESSYQFSIFGMGLINFITINGNDHKTGLFKGELYVVNKKGNNIAIPYLLFIKDKTSNKLYTKKTLPEQFTLINFTGLGHIDYTDIPRNGPEYTTFFLVGKAQYMT